MKLQEIRVIPPIKGIKASVMKKPELVRTIKKTEGDPDRDGPAVSRGCSRKQGLWRKDG